MKIVDLRLKIEGQGKEEGKEGRVAYLIAILILNNPQLFGRRG
jgi:hypothetical protein